MQSIDTSYEREPEKYWLCNIKVYLPIAFILGAFARGVGNARSKYKVCSRVWNVIVNFQLRYSHSQILLVGILRNNRFHASCFIFTTPTPTPTTSPPILIFNNNNTNNNTNSVIGLKPLNRSKTVYRVQRWQTSLADNY